MADYDPKITKLLESRCNGHVSEMNAAEEIVKLTGLDSVLHGALSVFNTQAVSGRVLDVPHKPQQQEQGNLRVV